MLILPRFKGNCYNKLHSLYNIIFLSQPRPRCLTLDCFVSLSQKGWSQGRKPCDPDPESVCQPVPRCSSDNVESYSLCAPQPLLQLFAGLPDVLWVVGADIPPLHACDAVYTICGGAGQPSPHLDFLTCSRTFNFSLFVSDTPDNSIVCMVWNHLVPWYGTWHPFLWAFWTWSEPSSFRRFPLKLSKPASE